MFSEKKKKKEKALRSSGSGRRFDVEDERAYSKQKYVEIEKNIVGTRFSSTKCNI